MFVQIPSVRLSEEDGMQDDGAKTILTFKQLMNLMMTIEKPIGGGRKNIVKRIRGT